MKRQFPPLEVATQSEGVEDTPTAWAEHWDKASDDFIGDAQWVYGRLGLPDAQRQAQQLAQKMTKSTLSYLKYSNDGPKYQKQ